MGDRDRWIALAGAIAVHIVLFAVIALGLTPRDKPAVSAQLKPVIKASAVSEEQVMEPYRKRLEAEAAEKRRIAEERRRAAEAKRRAEEARKKAAAEKKRKAEEAARRQAEAKRQAELKRKQEAEKARLAELERQRKIEAERKAAEAEKKRLESQRREAEERLKAQMAAEAEKLALEQQQFRSARISRLQDQYVAEITNKVERNWLRPPDSRGSLCSVLINQIPGGEIVGVRVTDCDGDVAFKRSVEAAVRKASPLPRPPEAELFQREIEFIFRPDR